MYKLTPREISQIVDNVTYTKYRYVTETGKSFKQENYIKFILMNKDKSLGLITETYIKENV